MVVQIEVCKHCSEIHHSKIAFTYVLPPNVAHGVSKGQTHSGFSVVCGVLAMAEWIDGLQCWIFIMVQYANPARWIRENMPP